MLTASFILAHLDTWGESVPQFERVCEEENINSHKLRMGSRRKRISQVSAQIVHQLVENFGIPLAEVAHQVGVSTSAVSKALNRTMKD